MAKHLVYLSGLAASVLIAACGSHLKKADKMTNLKDNTLLQEWSGNYGGVPAVDKVSIAEFLPAVDDGIRQSRLAVEQITKNPEPPTFANTLVAYEKSGKVLAQVMPVVNIWRGNLNGPEFQKIEPEINTKMAALRDEELQNVELFKRIDAVYSSSEFKKLTPEQQRLTWYHRNRMILNGVKLTEAEKKRTKEINQRLAGLYTSFTQNQLADEENLFLVIDKEADLDGLTKEQIDSAAAEAQRRGLKGQWVIANTRSSMEPFLTLAKNRALREKAFRIWTSRGDNGGKTDNNKIVTEILKLRQERSKLLGYPTFAHWNLADSMAKDPKAAMDLMLKAWSGAVAKVKTDVATMQKVVDKENGGFKIQPWDYRFYAEKVRKEKYDFDMEAVKAYLQLENVRKAMFWAAGELYGFSFVQVNDVPVFHSDVTVYEVLDRSKKHVGLWYFDPYARTGKSSGAWMDSLRDQQRIDKSVHPIVSNNSNFIKGKAGEPTYISWDDANTMFHEFGHALHGLNSNVTYPSLSGTNTARDFVELPSQVNEHWLKTPQVLRLLTNVKGEPMPQSLIEKLKKASTFDAGFATTEFLASGIVDMKLHLDTSDNIDPREFEKKALKELNMPSEIVMRHRIPAFSHLFSSEGYAAGYYGYLWAQVLDQDAYEAFVEAGNPYDRATADRLHKYIMSVGNTIDPEKAYRNFRGRDASVKAYLKSRGFPLTGVQ
jgi:peptidyl-dipeptidase Dcp